MTRKKKSRESRIEGMPSQARAGLNRCINQLWRDASPGVLVEGARNPRCATTFAGIQLLAVDRILFSFHGPPVNEVTSPAYVMELEKLQ